MIHIFYNKLVISLTFFIALLLIVVLSASTYLNVTKEREVLNDQLKQFGEGIAFASATSLIEPFLVDDIPAIETYIGQFIHAKSNIVGMHAYTADETLIASKGERADHVHLVEYSANIQLDDDILGRVNVVLSSKEANRKIKDSMQKTGLIWSAVTLVLIALMFYILKRLVLRPLNELVLSAKKLKAGNLDDEIFLSERNEFGHLATVLNQMRISLLDYRVQNKAQQDELKKKNLFKENIAVLNSKMLEAKNVKDLCQQAVDYISKCLKVSAGALYIEKNNELHFQSGFALPKQWQQAGYSIKPGEGLSGQSFASNETMILLPEGQSDFFLQSTFIEAVPTSIVASPIRYQHQVNAVLELALLRTLDSDETAFLEAALDEVGLSLNAVKQNELIKEALAESQAAAEELESQQEELRITNDELKTKSNALEQQSEELATTNASLSEKSDNLEKSKIEIEEKALQLEESSRYKSEFLANMSHELRTPLNSLLILSGMLADNDENNLSDDQIESATVIHDSGSHLLNLINDILDLSKIEAGHMEVAQEIVKISDLSLSMSARFSHMAKDKGIAFSVSGVEDTVDSIVSDGAKIEQILTNLIGNSIKFTDIGSVDLDFSVVANEGIYPGHEQLLAMAVKDTGIGIDESKQAAIFESFQQEDGSTSRNFGGTGLGLSISLAYSGVLGGGIQLVSEKGSGSTFTLYLPLGAANDDVKSLPVHTQKQASQDIDLAVDVSEKTLTLSPSPFVDDREVLNDDLPLLLVVEDDPKFSKILFNESKEQGYQCVVAVDAESALVLLQQCKVSGILLDLSLPRMSGREFLNIVKGDDAFIHIPVHIISALDNSGEELKKGAVGYYTKPVSKKQINDALNRLTHFAGKDLKRILLVEDDGASCTAIEKLLASTETDVTSVSTAKEATQQLKSDGTFDSVILDLGLPDKSGFDWLDEIEQDQSLSLPPVIIYSGKVLSNDEEARLSVYTDSIIIKSARSPERLLDEVSLFLHRVKSSKTFHSVRKNTTLSSSHNQFVELEGKRVLVVDDDMRNTFALSKALRSKKMLVDMNSSGEIALETLDGKAKYDVVLMDIMMPGLDGYETTRAIRQKPEYVDLPIIAVTAKAMKGDKQKCIEAGANDYLSKPIDMDKLQTMMLTWV